MLRKVGQLVDDPSIEKLDTNILKKNVNMLHRLQCSKEAWKAVLADTIKNCWKKAGFPIAGQVANVDGGTSAEVALELTSDIADLASLDQEAPAFVRPSESKEDIVQMIVDDVNNVEPEEEAERPDSDTTTLHQPSTVEIFNVLETLRCGLYAGHADSHLYNHKSEIENFF